MSAEKYVAPEDCICPFLPQLFKEATMKNLPRAIVDSVKKLWPDTGLVLWGAVGVGKTYTMCAIAKWFYRKGFTVERVRYGELCAMIRSTFQPKAIETEYDIINRFCTPDKLFIEDIGTIVSVGKTESDFSVNTLYEILDKRIEACKATFVTTNKSIEELSRSFNSRVASRLRYSCEIIHLTGEDKRRIRNEHLLLAEEPKI